jgi:hypothetical protein
LALWVTPVQLDQLVLPVPPGHKVLLALKVHPVYKVTPDRQDSRVSPGRWDLLGHRDLPVRMVRLDCRDHPVLRDHLVLPVATVLRVLLVRRVLRGRLVLSDFQVPLD